MIRLLGVFLLVGGCGALSVGAVGRLSGRVRDLGGLIVGLETLKQELQTSLDRLEPMLSAAAERTDGHARAFFQWCQKALRASEPEAFSVIWQAALEQVPLRLEPCDRTELRGLGPILGCYDADSQAAALDRAIRRLEIRWEEAQERRRSLGKVYGTLGLSAGAVLAILLI